MRSTLLAISLLATGCHIGVLGSAAPSIDTKRHFGTEQRVGGAFGFGNDDFRPYTALTVGGGYLQSLGRGYGVILPEAGFEGGTRVRWSVSGFVGLRLGSSPVGLLPSGGGAAQVLFRAVESPRSTMIVIGPRLSAEAASLPSTNPTLGPPPGSVGLFHLGLVVSWIIEGSPRVF